MLFTNGNKMFDGFGNKKSCIIKNVHFDVFKYWQIWGNVQALIIFNEILDNKRNYENYAIVILTLF